MNTPNNPYENILIQLDDLKAKINTLGELAQKIEITKTTHSYCVTIKDVELDYKEKEYYITYDLYQDVINFIEFYNKDDIFIRKHFIEGEELEESTFEELNHLLYTDAMRLRLILGLPEYSKGLMCKLIDTLSENNYSVPKLISELEEKSLTGFKAIEYIKGLSLKLQVPDELLSQPIACFISGRPYFQLKCLGIKIVKDLVSTNLSTIENLTFEHKIEIVLALALVGLEAKID